MQGVNSGSEPGTHELYSKPDFTSSIVKSFKKSNEMLDDPSDVVLGEQSNEMLLMQDIQKDSSPKTTTSKSPAYTRNPSSPNQDIQDI